MKKRVLLGLLCTCLVSELLFANGSQETTSKEEKPVTLTFWYENAGPNRTPYIEELISRFEKANPNIKIELTGLSNSDAKSKFDVAVAAKQTPDVSGMQVQWLAGYINNGTLEPLDEYVINWAEYDDQSKEVVKAMKAMDSKNQLYMLANTSNFTPIYWARADWFNEKGLKAPETWDDFFSDIEKLTDESKGYYGYSIRGGAGGPDQLTDYLYAYSGIDVPFTNEGKSTLNDPLHVEALERLAAIYKKNTPESDITNAYKEMVAAFDSGTVGIIQHNLGSYGEHSKAFKPEQFFAFVSPVGANGKRVASFTSNATGFCIYKSCQHKEEAFKFISFMCSEPSQSYFNEYIGQMPVSNSAANESWVQSRQHIKAAMAARADGHTVSFPYPHYLPDYAAINNKIAQPGFQAVLSGKMSAKDMLNQWADAMTKALAEYNKYVK